MLLALVLCAAGSLTTRSALAQTASACPRQTLRIEGALSSLWSTKVLELCDVLGAMTDRDDSAQLRLSPVSTDVMVEVTLPDGRSTLRRVHSPGELPQIVEALLVVPPPLLPESPPARQSSADSPAAVPAPALVPRAPGVASSSSVTAAPTPARSRLELGGGAGGRLAGTPLYASIGVTGYLGLRTGPWLLALAARWDTYQTVLHHRPKDFEMTTAGGGIQLLRSLLARQAVALEGGGTMWLLGETQAFDNPHGERACSIIDVRLGLLTRLLFGRGPLRGTVSLDADVSPQRLQRELHVIPGLPAMPAWSVGFGAGVAWEVP